MRKGKWFHDFEFDGQAHTIAVYNMLTAKPVEKEKAIRCEDGGYLFYFPGDYVSPNMIEKAKATLNLYRRIREMREYAYSHESFCNQ